MSVYPFLGLLSGFVLSGIFGSRNVFYVVYVLPLCKCIYVDGIQG